ncbi:Uncharacterized protein GBIM_13174, partial [Gryllus bimaculatus]
MINPSEPSVITVSQLTPTSNPAASPVQTPPTPVGALEPRSAQQPAAPSDDDGSLSSPLTSVTTVASSHQAPSRSPVQARGRHRSQFVQRVANIPLLRGLGGVYGNARALPLMGFALTALERAVWLACAPAALIVSPITDVCGAPLVYVDRCACMGLDAVERMFPCFFVPPEEASVHSSSTRMWSRHLQLSSRIVCVVCPELESLNLKTRKEFRCGNSVQDTVLRV